MKDYRETKIEVAARILPALLTIKPYGGPSSASTIATIKESLHIAEKLIDEANNHESA